MNGRHRSPPPALRTGWRWHTVAALAGLGILAPPVTLWAEAVALDASTCSPTSRTEGDTPCPPSAAVDANGLVLTRPIARPAMSTSALSPTSTVTVPARVAVRTPRPSRSATAIPSSSPPPIGSGQPGSAQGSTSVLETTLTRESPSSPDVTTPEPTPTTPLADPIAAATTESSATPTSEETPVTPEPTAEPTATVDVTAEATP